MFFDAIGKCWSYEVEGYQLPSGNYYLPDFVVHDWRQIHIEIKPSSISEAEKGAYLSMLGELEDQGIGTLLVIGEPWPGQYTAWRPWVDDHGGDYIEGPLFFALDRRDDRVITLSGDDCWFTLDQSLTQHDKWPIPHAGLNDAYTAARSARFEHRREANKE